MKIFERELEGFDPAERKTTMEMMTSWERKGKAEGIELGLQSGKQEIVIRLLRKRFGLVSEGSVAQIDRLSSIQLSELTEDLLDFTNIEDLEIWLARH